MESSTCQAPKVLVIVTIIYFRGWPIQTGDMNMIQSSPDVMHVNNPLESRPQELYYHGSQDMAIGVVIGFIFVEPTEGGCNKQLGDHAMVFLLQLVDLHWDKWLWFC